MEHHHLTRNGQKERERLSSAGEAGTALRHAADALVAEKSNQGARATSEPLHGGVLVRWRDEYLSGWQVLEIAACRAADCGQEWPAALMTVRSEVWPLSADGAGIWLVSGGGPWMSADLLAGQDEHQVVEGILAEHGARDAAKIIHSTSWRQVETWATHSWCAMLCCPDVHDHWPGALPVSRELLAQVGNPAPHAPDGPPLPRDIDVLFHALRHLSLLRRYARPERAKMSPEWQQHLRDWEPALAGMYSAVHVPEIIAEAG